MLVIGDAMLDSYLDGYTDRLSREAPVPVVTVTDRKDAAGGAANTAVNVRGAGRAGHVPVGDRATTRTGSCCAACSKRTGVDTQD